MLEQQHTGQEEEQQSILGILEDIECSLTNASEQLEALGDSCPYLHESMFYESLVRFLNDTITCADELHSEVEDKEEEEEEEETSSCPT